MNSWLGTSKRIPKILLVASTLIAQSALAATATVIDLSTGSGGPAQYTFDPGNGHLVTLDITANNGSLTQGLYGLGNKTDFFDSVFLDNLLGDNQETLTFTFSESVVLESLTLSWFDPVLTYERAELILDDDGNVITINEYNADSNGFSMWTYFAGEEVSQFTVSTPKRLVFGDSSFQINSLSVSAVPGSAVPVPAAAWLFGSAIIGLVGLKRKK